MQLKINSTKLLLSICLLSLSVHVQSEIHKETKPSERAKKLVTKAKSFDKCLMALDLCILNKLSELFGGDDSYDCRSFTNHCEKGNFYGPISIFSILIGLAIGLFTLMIICCCRRCCKCC